MKKKTKIEMSASELQEILKNRVVRMSCGHRFCFHLFSNTLIITTEGGVYCHNCYFQGQAAWLNVRPFKKGFYAAAGS